MKLFFFKNKSLVITIFTVLLSVLGQLLFVRFASFNIDKVDYGNYVLLQTLIAGMSAILLQIPSHAFDRFYNSVLKKSDFVNEFRTVLLFVNFLSVVFVVLYSQVITKFSFFTYVILILVFMLLNNFTINQKVFLLDLRREKYFLIKVTEVFAKFIFPIAFYYFLGTLDSLFVGMIFGYIISNFLVLYFLKELPFELRLNVGNLRKYFTFSYPVVFVAAFTWGISFSDRYFIEYYLSTEDVAIYSILAVVAGMGVIIGQIYFMYVEPKIYKEHDTNHDAALNMLNTYLLKLFGVFVLLLIVVFFMPKVFFTLIIDEELIGQDYYLNTIFILIAGVFLGVLHTAHHMFFKLYKRFDLLAYIYFVAFMVNIFSNFLIKDYGIIVAAASTLISYAVILILQIFIYRFILNK